MIAEVKGVFFVITDFIIFSYEKKTFLSGVHHFKPSPIMEFVVAQFSL